MLGKYSCGDMCSSLKFINSMMNWEIKSINIIIKFRQYQKMNLSGEFNDDNDGFERILVDGR